MSKCTHKRVKNTEDRRFMHCVNGVNCNPRAHGGVSWRQTCLDCGRERSLTANGRHEEASSWRSPERNMNTKHGGSRPNSGGATAKSEAKEEAKYNICYTDEQGIEHIIEGDTLESLQLQLKTVNYTGGSIRACDNHGFTRGWVSATTWHAS